MFNNKNTNLPQIVVYGILGIVVYVLWLFNHNFITPLLLGLIFATLSYPLYQKIDKIFIKAKIFKKTSSLSALTTLGLICGLLFISINIITQQFIKELPVFASNIIDFARQLPDNESVIKATNSMGIPQDTLRDIVGNLDQQDQKLGDVIGVDTNRASDLFTQENINSAFNIGRQSLNILFNQLVYFAIFALSWFNCLLYGKKWLDHIFKILPFDEKETKSITNDFQTGVRNVIYANFLSGAIHTTICALAMWAFGIQGIVILSVLIFFIGVLPLSPSELSYAIPVLLIFPINPIFSIILAIIGELVILWTNYILIPKIIASGREGNSLLILTSILSGISIFGVMGFIIGPLIIIFIQTLYSILVKRIGIENI